MSVEWYTPPEIVEAARMVLGKIDLDPASCLQANETIKAIRFYSMRDDGLSQQWSGRVFLNPPYSEKLVGRFIHKLIEHYRSADITEAIILTNNATETTWFQSLLKIAPVVCFVKGRLRFHRPDLSKNGTPLQGQAVAYFGSRPEVFGAIFSRFGTVLCHEKRHETTGLFRNPEGRPASFGRPMSAAERQARHRMKTGK